MTSLGLTSCWVGCIMSFEKKMCEKIIHPKSMCSFSENIDLPSPFASLFTHLRLIYMILIIKSLWPHFFHPTNSESLISNVILQRIVCPSEPSSTRPRLLSNCLDFFQAASSSFETAFSFCLQFCKFSHCDANWFGQNFAVFTVWAILQSFPGKVHAASVFFLKPLP